MNAPLSTPIEGEIIHEDGIWFGLDESEYRADPALGSSDLKALAKDPTQFWWSRSGLDPDEDTEAKKLGRAVHKFVLEGRDAFEAAYGRAALNGSTKAGKDESAEIAASGRERLKAKDYDRAAAAATVIRANPDVEKAFSGGMPEVSIFWTDMVDGEPVRRKGRFDYLKPRAIVDLKSTAPFADWTFAATWRKAIKNWRYDIQASAYARLRQELPRLVAEGRVFGDHDPAWLARVAAEDAFAFAFIFWSSSGAPIAAGGYLSPGNPLLERGDHDVARALVRYLECKREFGEDRAWIRPEPFAEISVEEVDQPWRANDAA